MTGQNATPPPSGGAPGIARVFGTIFAIIITALVLRSCAISAATPPPTDHEKVAASDVRLDSHYLDRPVGEAAAAVADVRTALGDHLAAGTPAAIALDRATRSLAELMNFDLPVTRARDALLMAAADHDAGRPAARDKALDEAAIQLSWAVEHAAPARAESATALLSLLNGVQDLDRSTPQFTAALANLCQGVQHHLDAATDLRGTPQPATAPADTVPAAGPGKQDVTS